MYKLQPNDWHGNTAQVIFDVTNSRWIPFDPANTDYQAFLKYQAEGGVALPADKEVA
jgi:hypothetical protein